MDYFNEKPSGISQIGILAIVLVIAVILAGGVYWYTRNRENTNGNTNTVLNQNLNVALNKNTNVVANNQNGNANKHVNVNSATNADVNSGLNTNSQQLDFQTYSNFEYNFSIGYPKEWHKKEFGKLDNRTLEHVEFGPEEINSLGSGKGKVSLSILHLQLNNGFTPEDIGQEMEVSMQNSANIEIGGKQAISYTAVAETMTKGLAILLDPNLKLILLVGSIYPNYFDIFDRMTADIRFSL